MSGSVFLKGYAAFRKLKDANRLCNLEAISQNLTNKSVISSLALKHNEERRTFFKNAKINWDKQNKHIPGKHNYQNGKSIFLHKDPEKLIRDFAGRGEPIHDRLPGIPDYRERVNFGENIGFYVNPSTNEKIATTIGEIRYSNNGVHIIPVVPR